MSEPAAETTGPGFWETVRAELLDGDQVDLVLRLTALLAMANAVKPFAPKIVVALMMGATLFSRTLLRSRGWWLMVTFFVVSTTSMRWYTADNHKWLWGYWLFACAIAAGERGDVARRVLAFNGRWLMGLCMLAATIWKIVGWQYFDGSFFVYTLHFDSRFAIVTQQLGQPGHAYQDARQAFGRVASSLQPQSVTHTQAMLAFALFACYWTIFIEALWSLAFCSTRPRWLHDKRDLVALVFIATTYFLAPVHGFGSLLVVMGLAQCPVDKWRTRLGYLAALVMLHVAYPWTQTVWRIDPGALGNLIGE